MKKRKLISLVAGAMMTTAAAGPLGPKYHDIWDFYTHALRPLPEQSPAEFAAEHRILHELYCSERPGPWDNSVFPYQPHVMNVVQEAITTGKRGVVFMKAGQIGGTDCMINAMLWLKLYFPGPQLFMTSTDKVANEFGRERFALIIPDMEPLRRNFIPSKRGQILVKRFTDGKITLCGGQSVFNLQSTPYRVVVIDELDSLVQDLGGTGDPLKLAEVRTDSFSGQTLMIAYAHPTTKEHGAAKLFFENSDQRRGFVTHDCGHSFYLQWEHVKAVGDETDPHAYSYVCPQCGAVISDAERVAMVRKVEYRSVLDPEVAKKKAWIGVHASQLYSPAKSILSFAQRWCDCRGDENQIRVFYNKVLGEPYEPKVKTVDISTIRSLIVVKRRVDDPEFYSRGQVPAGVRFLTAGQDSRNTELHYAVWGWGLRRSTSKMTALCGWLIDWGVIKRAYSPTFSESEYHVFDDLIYRREFPATAGDRMFSVRLCGHDSSYAPTQIPLVRYCRNFPHRAAQVKGASLNASSASNAPYARWGTAMKFKAGEEVAEDITSRALILNTFLLKTDLFGWMDPTMRIEIYDVAGNQRVGVRKVPRLILPEDVDDEFLEQSKNEALVKGKKSGELVWKKTGPNHFADTNTYAYGCALQLDPYQRDQTDEEHQAKKASRRHLRREAGESEPEHDPAMG